MSVVVSDTSPLHYLILCGVDETLPRLFKQVIIPPAVFAELVHANTPTLVRQWAESLPPWVAVQSPNVIHALPNVDAGEQEAISLAKEIQATALLIDDRAGRQAAIQLGVPVIGTLGLLEQAAIGELIDLPQVIERLRQTNARLDSALIDLILTRHNARRGGTKSR